MTSVLPTIPRFVFTVFEPISLLVYPASCENVTLTKNSLAGAVAPVISPEWFVAEQIALSPLEPITANAKMVALQLGNIYLLLAMVGIAVLYATTEAKVVRNYVIALWLADIGHVAVTCYVMEYQRVVDVAKWNAMAWGNIGVTVVSSTLYRADLTDVRTQAALFSVRTAYLLGIFGPDKVPALGKAQKLQ